MVDDAARGPLRTIRGLLEEQGLSGEFPEQVDREVEAWLKSPGLDDPDLEDLTHLPFVTIDNASSRDLDQAAWVESDGDAFEVWYALADAAYYVRPGSALFAEALARGASYYLPTTMVPMLPTALSEGLVSLNPDVDRRATVFRTRVGADGQVLGTTILRARIRSRHKLSFERVQTLYDDGDTTGLADGVADSLRALREVGLIRMREATERNVVRYRRSELSVGVEGMRFVVDDAVRHPVERYNEQLSLLCNVEGAKFLRKNLDDARVQPIFRVHPPPEEDRIAELTGFLKNLRKKQDLDAETWDPKRARSTAEWLDGLPTGGRMGRIAVAVHRQAVMVNGRSTYRGEPGIHFGVGAEVYARFSAPMREIVGIYLHKEIWERLNDAPAGSDEENLALMEEVVRSANRSRDLQRTLNNRTNEVVLDHLFRDAEENGWERLGTVVGMARKKVYVLIDDPHLDVKAYVPHLSEAAGEALHIGDDQVTLRGEDDRIHVRVGDAVKVRVVGRDRKRRRWKFGFAETDAG